MKLRSLVLAMFTLIVTLPVYAQDAFVFPALTGMYQVGVATYPLVDETREEIFSEDLSSKREVLVTVYYPAMPEADTEAAPYAEGALRDYVGIPPEQLDQTQTQIIAG